MTANIVGTATDKHLRTALSPLIMILWEARKKMAALTAIVQLEVDMHGEDFDYDDADEEENGEADSLSYELTSHNED